MDIKVEWNYDEFATFLMIYASHVDLEFSDSEKERIKAQISDATFEKMYKAFRDKTDFESLQTILAYKGLYYPTEARKAELLDKVKMIFFADGEYSQMEMELYNFFKKLM